MHSLTIEFQRFGDPIGVIRLSDRYIRTIGTTAPTEEVGFEIPQQNLRRGMRTLDYGNFGGAGGAPELVRATAEHFLTDIAPGIRRFLHGEELDLGPHELVQIDVVARALELSQLPFEILEDDHDNVVVTRRIRQPWPAPEVVRENVPRVLFVWAEPRRRAGSDRRMTVPHERHRELLVELLRDFGPDALVEVPNASRARIEAALAQGGFTHVHVLAHGLPYEGSRTGVSAGERIDLHEPPPPTVCVALEDDEGVTDACPPREFANLFTSSARPETFTLATCHSGEVDSIHEGGTIAHILHAEGIPVVLASQLALTQDGSQELVRTFLASVVNGSDPREALRRTRDALRRTRDETYYDRIALVGYIHLESNVEERLKERRFQVALAHLQAATREAEARVAEAVVDLAGAKALTLEQRRYADNIRRRFEAVRVDLAQLEPLRSLTRDQRQELRGLQASSLKREAQAAFQLSRVLTGSGRREWSDYSVGALELATNAYRHAATSRDHHWTWVQWLALKAVQDGTLESLETDWIVTRRIIADALEREDEPHEARDPERVRELESARVWAHGSLAELLLLSPLAGQPEALDEARAALDELVRRAEALEDDYPLEATRAQLRRYFEWWNASEWRLPREIAEAARALHEHLATLDAPSPAPEVSGTATVTHTATSDSPPAVSGTDEDAPSPLSQATGSGRIGPSMFRIEMLPADEGDALWIEYGDAPTRRILIDCGRKTAYRAAMERLGDGPDPKLELFVLTHVDADHIAGAVPLLQDPRFTPDRVKDVWFNGWRHLNGLHFDSDAETPGTLSAKQGEYFGAVLRDRGFTWNGAFDGHAVVLEDEGALPSFELAGGMKLTLLGPTWDKLHDMRDRWERDLRRGPLDPGDFDKALELLGGDRAHGPDVLSGRGHEGPLTIDEIERLIELPFDPDESEPNGSSISFLAEYEGRAVLFAGDAHAPQLEASIARLLEARGLERLSLDALKMAHHASARNNSSALLERIDAPRYLVSSNGSRHHHPDRAALARVLDLYESGVEFHFNYASEETEPWGAEELRERFRYDAIYPTDGAGLRVEL